jgi:hypothetical protein
MLLFMLVLLIICCFILKSLKYLLVVSGWVLYIICVHIIGCAKLFVHTVYIINVVFVDYGIIYVIFEVVKIYEF